ALAVHLVEDAGPVFADGVPFDIGVARTALLAGRLPSGSHLSRSFLGREPLAPFAPDVIHLSISESSAVWPWWMSESRSSAYPCAIVITIATAPSSESAANPYSRSAGAKASVSTRRHSSFTCWTRARSSGRFHASACSSSQIFEYPLERSSS